MSRVLVIPDLHEPCARPGALQFCKAIKKEHKCDTIVFIGDVTDWHSISFHARHPEMPGPKDEFKLAFKCLKKWYRAFPKATICLGNHDRRIERLAESVNIPKRFIRGYDDIWKTPGWKWVDEIIIDKVLYEHGEGQGGSMYPAFNKVKGMGMSCVIGHHHSAGGVKWLVNPLRRMFGLDTGALIDDKAMAFAYNKKSIKRSVLSAAVVIDGVPQHIIMPCGKGEKYHDSNFK
jgi:metallophosphoesterase superfamily enzyme